MFWRRFPLASSFLLFFAGVLSGLLVSFLYSQLDKIVNLSPMGEFFNSTRSRITRNSSILFVGGFPRSGTTLMRVLLDAHPSFHCGQETHIIPDLLTLRRKYASVRRRNRLKEAGIDPKLINTIIADSILNIITNHGSISKRLCSKDPFVLKHIPYLGQMFPNAQFILMVRDGRGVVHSIRQNKVTISYFPKTDREGLRRWSQGVNMMFNGCLDAGPNKCIIVHYESLVLEPRVSLEKILRFLGARWSESVLKHTQFLDMSEGISLSRLEKSTNQVRRPIYNDSLYSWLSSPVNIPSKELISLAPMMNTLGYTDAGQPPQYWKLRTKDFHIRAKT